MINLPTKLIGLKVMRVGMMVMELDPYHRQQSRVNRMKIRVNCTVLDSLDKVQMMVEESHMVRDPTRVLDIDLSQLDRMADMEEQVVLHVDPFYMVEIIMDKLIISMSVHKMDSRPMDSKVLRVLLKLEQFAIVQHDQNNLEENNVLVEQHRKYPKRGYIEDQELNDMLEYSQLGVLD